MRFLSKVGFATSDHSHLKESETEKATDRLASGAQSIPTDIPTHGEGPSEEHGFPLDDEDSDGESNPWEPPEGASDPVSKAQTADLFNEDWDLELKTDQENPYACHACPSCQLAVFFRRYREPNQGPPMWRYQGLNPGSHMCEAGTQPLSYIHSIETFLSNP
nr:coordinator of PRMT5 and differentiation stimulator isoform X5 [Dasypus novemcinctus]